MVSEVNFDYSKPDLKRFKRDNAHEQVPGILLDFLREYKFDF